MGIVAIDMSMSLDGYIAAPNDVPGDGLGEHGMRLHNWGFDNPGVFERVFGTLIEDTGAVIMGRRTYDNSIPEWGGGGPIGDVPCFVLTHEAPSSAAPLFTFVTDGVESAIAKAREVAGDKRIGLMGADVPRQFLAAGLVDEIRIHLVDVLLGGGRRMFDELPQRVELKQTGLGEPAASRISCTASSDSRSRGGDSNVAKYQDVDEYMAQLPDDRRAVMERLRSTIRSAAPDASEAISYNMPAFRLGGRFLVSYEAFKRHYSLFPWSDGMVTELGEEMKPYAVGKGTIQFPADKPIPFELVRRIVEFRNREVGEEAAAPDVP